MRVCKERSVALLVLAFRWRRIFQDTAGQLWQECRVAIVDRISPKERASERFFCVEDSHRPGNSSTSAGTSERWLRGREGEGGGRRLRLHLICLTR